MSDEQNAPVVEAPAPETTPEEKPAEKVYTQSEVEKMLQKRLGKFGDYDEIKAKAAKADELEAAQMSEIEKATKRAEQAEAKAAEIETRAKAAELAALRTRIGSEKGLPGALIDRLHGEDEETIRTDADALLAAMPKSSTPPLPGAVNDVDEDPAKSDPFLAGMRQVMKR